jgi:tetratricopeptide (TPR) repeat protein
MLQLICRETMANGSDNFINELKFDELKENIKAFMTKYYKYLFIGMLAIFAYWGVNFSLKTLETNRIQSYNKRIFMGLSSDRPIEELEKIYEGKHTPSVSRTFSGLNLVGEYMKVQQYDRVVEIYEDIFNYEKDIYLRYYAGLNLLIAKLNEEQPDFEKIDRLFSRMENSENPLLSLVLEQKALFFLKQKKYAIASEIIGDILKRDEIDNNFRDRLSRYLDFSQSNVDK